MNYKFILLIILFFQVSCANQTLDKKIELKTNTNYFINKGFTLIYNDDLYKKRLVKGKIDDRSLILFQKNLRKNSSVKITNLINSKYIIAKVGNKIDYPFFYNSVIEEVRDDLPAEIKHDVDNMIFSKSELERAGYDIDKIKKMIKQLNDKNMTEYFRAKYNQ